MIDPSRAKSLGLRLGAAWLAPGAVLAASIVGVTAGLGTALLVLAGAALVGAILLFWSSLERLTGESPLTLDEAIGLGAPSAEEERKRAVVRGLKDLEYERGVGKISEADYAELSARYRTEAKALLRALDTELSPQRKAAEERLAKRLAAAGLPPAGGTAGPGAAAGGPSNPSPPAEPEVTAATAAAGVGPVLSHPACSKCETPNDADASFCKRCGAPLAPLAPGAAP